MAEQIRTEETTVTIKYHDFHCDECNCIVGTSTEEIDGGYARYGMCELQVLTPFGTYECYDKCLCDGCKETFFANTKQALEDLGFVCREEV